MLVASCSRSRGRGDRSGWSGRAPWSWSTAPRALRRRVLRRVRGSSGRCDAGSGRCLASDTAHERAPSPVRCAAGRLPRASTGCASPTCPPRPPPGPAAGFPCARPPLTVVVHRGDCLWSVAAGLLGPGADATDVVAAGRRDLRGQPTADRARPRPGPPRHPTLPSGGDPMTGTSPPVRRPRPAARRWSRSTRSDRHGSGRTPKARSPSPSRSRAGWTLIPSRLLLPSFPTTRRARACPTRRSGRPGSSRQ